MLPKVYLNKAVKSEMKQYIINNKMKPGDILPTEKEFSDILGVSRTIIREAFSGLESLNLIETYRGKGRFVKEISYNTILDNLSFILELQPNEFQSVLEIRKALEHHYLPLTIDSYSDQNIDQLQEIFERLKKEMTNKNSDENDESRVIEIHSEYHRMFYINCGNKLLLDIIQVFASMQKFYSKLSNLKTSDKMIFIKQHEDLLIAIKNKDKKKVVQLLDHHFDEVSTNLTKIRKG